MSAERVPGRSGGDGETAVVDRGAALLERRIGEPPEVFLVLGSGLGSLARSVEAPVRLPYGEIPGLRDPRVEGHAGAFVVGTLEGRRVLVQSGRLHLYEGHRPAVVIRPVRIAAALGADVAVMTNAAGGIRRDLVPGSLLLLDDQINLMWTNPLTGPVLEGEERFPDMSAPYDPDLQARAAEVAGREGIRLARGSYVGVPGPSYETPAEIRMLRRLGADAVGMSTVPEVVAARARGMRVAGISLVTNRAAGLSAEPLSHREVMEVGERAAGDLARLVRGLLRALP